MVQGFKQHDILYPVVKFFILDAAELNKGSDILPVALEGSTVLLEYGVELIRNLFGDVAADFLHVAVVLQKASGNVQGKVGTINDAFQQHQVFRHHLLDVVGDVNLVVVKLNLSRHDLKLVALLRKIENPLQIKGIIHIQMNPEQGRIEIHEYLPVEAFIFLFGAVLRLFQPQRLGVVYRLLLCFGLLAGFFLLLG